MSKFNIALIGGTGAVGQTIAAKLQSYLDQDSNLDKPKIYIVGRTGSSTVENLRNKGSITLVDKVDKDTEVSTTVALKTDQVVESLHQIPKDLPKFPIFMTKGGKPMDEAVKSMVDDAEEGGEYIGAAVLQNGVGNAEKILATSIVKPQDLMYSTLNVASSLTGIGEVKQQNPNYKILLGNPSGQLSEASRVVFNLLQKAGLKVEESQEIEKRMWIKLMWNTAFNGVAAVHGKTVGEIYADASLAGLVKNLMQEVRSVALAKGIEINDTEFESEYSRAKIPSWVSFKPSTLQDKTAGRKLELDSIWQEVVNEASEYGVEVPNVKELLAELRKIDKSL